jgi:hypothetical protein
MMREKKEDTRGIGIEKRRMKEEKEVHPRLVR